MLIQESKIFIFMVFCFCFQKQNKKKRVHVLRNVSIISHTQLVSERQEHSTNSNPEKQRKPLCFK